jgi:hypothetical protein
MAALDYEFADAQITRIVNNALDLQSSFWDIIFLKTAFDLPRTENLGEKMRVIKFDSKSLTRLYISNYRATFSFEKIQ